MQKVKLSSFFSSLKPKYLLGTTYTLSLTFFESVVWPTIPKGNLDNCLILCDHLGYRRAMSEAGTLRDIGARYFVVPISAQGKFHPKVWIAANDEKVCLLVGSGNLTQSGFIDNVELFWMTQFDRKEPAGIITEDVRLFLGSLEALIDNGIPSSDLAQGLIRSIRGLIPNWDGTNSLPRLLTSFHQDPETGKHNLPKEMQPYGAGGRLYIASPYFGGNLSGYELLTSAIFPSKVVLCPGVMDNGQIDFDIRKNGTLLQDVDVMKMAICKTVRRGEHFKVYGHQAQSGAENWIFCGSANCTYPGLTGRNIEAGILLWATVEDLADLFCCEKLEEYPVYTKENDKDQDLVAPLIFAAFTDNGVKLSISTHSPLSPPFYDVTVEYRVGVSRSVAICDTFFLDNSIESIPRDQFDQEFPSSIFASPYLMIKGKDEKQIEWRVVCIIDDINTLRASSREKGATRAAGAAGRGVSPELADIVEYYKYLEEAMDEGFSLEGKKSGTRKDKGDSTEEVDRIAIWPPEPVSLQATTSTFNDSSRKYYFFWLDRMLNVFDTKKPQVPSVSYEGADEDDDERAANGSTKQIQAKAPKEWVEASRRAEAIEVKFAKIVLNSRQANCVFPTIILSHLMLLAIMESFAGEVKNPDDVMAPSTQIAARMIKSLFADRRNNFGELGYSIAEVCHRDFEVPIYKQFAEDIIVAFVEILSEDKANFPIHSWLKFKGMCRDGFSRIVDAADDIWARYTRHFPWHERGLTRGKFVGLLEQLAKIEWDNHPGFIAAREIISAVKHGRKIDPDLVGKQAAPHVSKVSRRMKTGLRPYLPVRRFDCFCKGERCSQSFITKATFRQLEHLHPVICESCGTALIPDVLFDVIESNHD